jgi:hypothetical protein
MPSWIAGPTRIEAAGNPPKTSSEYAGRVSTGPGEVSGWRVGGPAEPPALAATAGTGWVALTGADLAQARAAGAFALALHEVAERPVPRAGAVEVTVPPYRGKQFVLFLSWLVVERLAAAGADVGWCLTPRQGPDSIHALLAGQGWRLVRERLRTGRGGPTVRLRGQPPARVPQPIPESFTTALGHHPEVPLLADYGVFSPHRVDAGTGLLLAVALAQPPVPRVADIGVGYGPLATGLLLNRVAGSAVGTDVDSVALWLAGQNARANRISLDLALTGDPTTVEETGLTVCNLPTHLAAAESAGLLAGLVARARPGRVLVVVHASLAERYARHLLPAGPVHRHPGARHVVLAVGPR